MRPVYVCVCVCVCVPCVCICVACVCVSCVCELRVYACRVCVWVACVSVPRVYVFFCIVFSIHFTNEDVCVTAIYYFFLLFDFFFYKLFCHLRPIEKNCNKRFCISSYKRFFEQSSIVLLWYFKKISRNTKQIQKIQNCLFLCIIWSLPPPRRTSLWSMPVNKSSTEPINYSI